AQLALISSGLPAPRQITSCDPDLVKRVERRCNMDLLWCCLRYLQREDGLKKLTGHAIDWLTEICLARVPLQRRLRASLGCWENRSLSDARSSTCAGSPSRCTVALQRAHPQNP